MSPAKVLKSIPLEEYLESERLSPFKREYIWGQVRAMAGTTERHNRLVLRIFSALNEAAEAKGCRLLVLDVRLKISEQVRYYPDLMLICDPHDNDPLDKEKPRLLVEVLSASTKNVDLLEKKLAYTGLPTLENYLIFDAERRKVIGLYRTPDGFEERRWSGSGKVEVRCLETTLDIESLYKNL